MYGLACLLVFLSAYTVNVFYITVLYHRGLTHRAIAIRPWALRFVAATGNWVTGLDPKGWACMHRLHHLHSDTRKDPHSPKYGGVFRLLLVQLRSYNKTLVALIRQKPEYTSIVQDLRFPVSWLNRARLWYLPYVLHLGIGLAIGALCHAWFLGLCYWLGMMSHPIQGWMVNALGHSYGYRNFKTNDNSRNNTLVAWLVAGEGFQNNHHQSPSNAKFSVRWWELDMGYGLCRAAEFLRIIDLSSSGPKERNEQRPAA